MKDIVIVAGARDYHAVDWYRTIKKHIEDRKVLILTDLIDSEEFDVIVDNNDNIEKLFIIDKFLFKKQSRLGSIWRNIFKLIVLPYQVYLLKKYVKRSNNNNIYHAQPMYYMFLCMLADVEYIGTPQGSEVLVRPYRSKLYRYFAIKALQSAKYVTVDSINMKNEIFKLSGVNAIIIQNGVDTDTLVADNKKTRDKITSIRGMTELYRIDEILKGRNNVDTSIPINFIYPFGDKKYKNNILKIMQNNDNDLGRLDKKSLYNLLSESYLIISIPISDSSPRSVYEAIFSGCCVAVTYNIWIEALPQCMKERLYIVDLNDKEWFRKANEKAKLLLNIPYVASREALEMFNQDKSMLKAIEILYNEKL